MDLHPRYAKALLRRSTAYEKLDDLERALADAQKVGLPSQQGLVIIPAKQRHMRS